MKQKHLGGRLLAAALVGVMGGGAAPSVFADDHLPVVQCPIGVPAPCVRKCEAYGECIVRCDVFGLCDRDTECWFRANDFLRCLENYDPSPVLPGPGIFLPPACPEGQHRGNDGECQADHECGDDEIGGGSVECEACGDGQVPNEDGTACQSCQLGETGPSSGRCAANCSNDELDAAAKVTLEALPKNGWEEFKSYTCDTTGAMIVRSLGSNESADDVCIDWETQPFRTVSSALGHSHPHFELPRDKLRRCHGERINNTRTANKWNARNERFSDTDKLSAKRHVKPLYLVVPRRDVVKVYRIVGRWFGVVPKWGVEIVE